MSDEQVKNQMRQDASTAQEDSTSVVEQESIEEKMTALQKNYGFDIVYNPEDKTYELKGMDLDVLLHNTDVDYEEWYNNYLKEMRETFSGDVEFQTETKDLYQAILDNDLPAGYYQGNTVTLVNYTLKPEQRDECIRLLQEKGYTKEESNVLIDSIIKPSSQISTLEHETSHQEDHYKYGNQQYDLPPQYMAKLNMLTEIKANMTEAGLALDMYKATGNLEHFDQLCIDTTELQKTLKENPNMKNMEEYVAKYVYDEWMKEYNQTDSLYSNQAYAASSPSDCPYPVWALTENPETLKNYHERSDAMFENIEGLGDIRKYINADFELNDELKKKLAQETNECCPLILKEIMVKDAKNAEQVSENLAAFLEKIKQIDADGTRTPEELEQLDQYIQKILHPSEQEAEFVAQNNNTLTTVMQRRQSKQR